MTKFYLLIFFSFLLFPSDNSVDISPSPLFSQDELHQDIDYLVESLIEIHPHPFAYFSEDTFFSAVQELKADIDKELTRIEFAKRAIPLINLLKEGHTELNIPSEEYDTYKENGLIFPYKVSLEGDDIIINLSGGPETQQKTLKSLNGIPAERLLEEMRSYTSAERKAFQNVVIEKRFTKLVWFILGEVEQFEITFYNQNKTLVITKEDIVDLESDETGSNLRPDFAFTINNKVSIGILTFNSMRRSEDFENFLKTSFQKMDEQNINRLIIDLRFNSGGNSELGTALLHYISAEPFKQVDKMLVKASSKQKAYIRENYVPWYIYPFAFFSKIGRATFAKDGKETEIVFEAEKPDFGFDGEVAVLTSNLTFSSASILANAIKCNNMGILIGEETGGLTVFYGDNIEIELPHTKLKGTVSFKKFYLPCGEENLRGVIPDMQISDIDRSTLEEILPLTTDTF